MRETARRDLRGDCSATGSSTLIRDQKMPLMPTGYTHKLWKQFIAGNDPQALQSLLDYAAADASNLFKLADTLIEWAETKLTVQEKQQQAGVNLQNTNS